MESPFFRPSPSEGATDNLAPIVSMVGRLPVGNEAPMTREQYAHYVAQPYQGIIGIAVHHVAATSTVEATASFHTRPVAEGGRGWPNIGYYAFIDMDGTTYICNSLDTASYHVAGRNHELLGIVFNGDLTASFPTDAQIRAFNRLHPRLVAKLGYDLPVNGHKHWALPSSPSACPGGLWAQWKHRLLP